MEGLTGVRVFLLPAVALYFFGACTPGLPNLSANSNTRSNVPAITLTGGKITVNPSQILRPADSHLIGFARNHIASGGSTWLQQSFFPNGASKLAAMKNLTPNWGQKKALYRIGGGYIDGRLDYNYMPGYHFLNFFGSSQVYPYNGASDTIAYPYDDIRNSLAEAQLMDADQIHTINFGTGSSGEAGQYTSFANHVGDTLYAQHPMSARPAPIQMFELGNEISWNMEAGHDQKAPNEIAYALNAVPFARAIRQNSDTPVQIGAVLSANMSLTGNGWSNPDVGIQNILDNLGGDIDFLIYHGYAPGWPMAFELGQQPAGKSTEDAMNSFFSELQYHRDLLTQTVFPVINRYKSKTGKTIYLANTEFLSSYNDVDKARGMFGALWSADQSLEAMDFDIRTSVNFCLSHADIADSLFFIHDDPTQTTGVYRWLYLFSKHWGDQVVLTQSSSIPTRTFTNNGFTEVVNRLQVASAVSNDKSKLYVMVLNLFQDADVIANIIVTQAPKSIVAYNMIGSEGLYSTSAQIQNNTIQNASLTNYNFVHASITIFEMVL